MVQFGLVRSGPVRFSVVRFGLVRFGLVRFGLVWSSSVWFGSFGFGLVWFDLSDVGLVNVIEQSYICVLMEEIIFKLSLAFTSKRCGTIGCI